MAVGRKRQSASIHVLNGTYKPHRHGPKDAPPLLPPATLEAPEWLPDEGKEEWRRIVKVLEPAKVLTEGDQAVLITYCGLYCELVNLVRLGLPVPPPTAAQLRLCASELGLTPASRAKLSTSRGKKENEFAGFAEPERPGPTVRRTGR